MEIWVIYLLAFLAAAFFVYSAFHVILPSVAPLLERDYLEIDKTLKTAFYTDFDAKVFVGLKYGGALSLFFIGVFLLNSIAFGVFLGLVMYVVPGWLLNRIVKRRKEKLEDQVSDVMVALSATIKSGMTLEESIGEVATKMRAPIAEEFKAIRDRIDAGETIVAALQAVDKRLQLPRLSLVFQSIIVAQQRGGRLSVLMESLGEAIREIQRVEERVRTETSGLILSSRIMVGMPVLICMLLYLIEPEQVTMLFNTLIGNIVLIVAIVLNIGAFRIMSKIVDLEG